MIDNMITFFAGIPWSEIGKATLETIYITFASTLIAYIIGLPLGVVLKITDKNGITPNRFVYKVLDVIINILRSAPFVILMIFVIPLTRLIVGKSYGATATIVPLVIAAAPFIARTVESSLSEVDQGVVEAAQSLGATNMTIITKVMLLEARTSLLINMTIVFGTILGYSAMAGTIGGGGLGALAINYGYYRYKTDIMVITLVILIVIVQLFQMGGMWLAKKLDRRNRT